MVGDTAVVCYAVDRATHKRYIVDAIKITRPTPAAIRQLIFDWTSLSSNGWPGMSIGTGNRTVF